MRKKIKYISIVVAFFIIIAAILVHNRAEIKTTEKVIKLSEYPVNVDTVRSRFFVNHLNLVGTINANNDVPIVSEQDGKVTKVYAEIGNYEKAGSTLIQLEDELELAAYQTAKVNYDKTSKDYTRYNSLYKSGSVTDAQLENAKLAEQSAEAQYIAAKKNYDDTKITTPISGIVVSRPVNIGDYINKREVVAEVVDISLLKVLLNVSEQNVFALKVGDKVNVTTSVYPGVTFPGKIKTISDKGNAAHTYPVEVILSNSKQHPLKAGMFANVVFNSQPKNKSLAIPREALLGSVKDAKVYVDENNVAKIRNLVIGNSSNNFLEVLSGLKPGDIVIVNGQNNLKENYKVKVTE